MSASARKTQRITWQSPRALRVWDPSAMAHPDNIQLLMDSLGRDGLTSEESVRALVRWLMDPETARAENVELNPGSPKVWQTLNELCWRLGISLAAIVAEEEETHENA
jgi:hypothetical protein